jgi:signal transduction histidine kinase
MSRPRERTRRVTPTDLAPGVGLAVVGAASLLAGGGDESDRGPDALGYALVVAAALALIGRRHRPVAVFAVSMGATATAGILGYATGGTPSIAPLLALGSAAYYTSRRTTIALAAAASLLLAVLHITLDDSRGAIVDEVVPDFLVVWLAALAGDFLRGQHAYARTLEQRTEELAQLRGAEKRDAIVAERARIARDMHDIVGHALAAIALQARAGRRRLTHGAIDRADVALGEIDTLAGQALADTRRAVGLLRSADAGVPATRQPTLSDLDELIVALRTADIQIDVDRDGPTTVLPAPVQAVAYRVVQEALSNVVKHAQPAHATVTLRQDGEGLVIDVRDDGAARDRPHRPGHGLRGMRERVEAIGGTLHAGPAAGAGWHVRARLPQTPA